MIMMMMMKQNINLRMLKNKVAEYNIYIKVKPDSIIKYKEDSILRHIYLFINFICRKNS